MMDADDAKLAFARAVAPVPVADEPSLVKQKSRDFYWYSPILKGQLRHVTADLVVAPRTTDEVIAVVRECVARRVPLTVRGAGTGNYGQAMPLEGGVIMDMTAMTATRRRVSPGVIRVEPGLKLIDLETQTLPTGWELRFHPSTRRTATIGGFIGGGSAGVGSINYGVLRDRGNVLALKVVTMEPSTARAGAARRRRAEGRPRLWHQRHHRRAGDPAGARLALGRRDRRLPRFHGGRAFRPGAWAKPTLSSRSW